MYMYISSFIKFLCALSNYVQKVSESVTLLKMNSAQHSSNKCKN